MEFNILPFVLINTSYAADFMYVCSAASYTILLKYADIAAIHILFMIAIYIF